MTTRGFIKSASMLAVAITSLMLIEGPSIAQAQVKPPGAPQGAPTNKPAGTPPKQPLFTSTPEFAPAAQTFTDKISVNILCSTPGAMIRYTTNGTAPTQSSALYAGPLKLTSTTTILAKAFAAGMYDSQVASATYTKKEAAAQPVFSPAGPQTFTDKISVSISCPTPGVKIRYSTDGNTPTSSSPVYKGPLALSSTATVIAVAFKAGMNDSQAADATYTKLEPVGPPAFDPPGPRTFTDKISVSISCPTPGATIRYTTNGSPPSASSPICHGPLSLTSSTTLMAKAFKTGMGGSQTASATYTQTLPGAAQDPNVGNPVEMPRPAPPTRPDSR